MAAVERGFTVSVKGGCPVTAPFDPAKANRQWQHARQAPQGLLDRAVDSLGLARLSLMDHADGDSHTCVVIFVGGHAKHECRCGHTWKSKEPS